MASIIWSFVASSGGRLVFKALVGVGTTGGWTGPFVTGTGAIGLNAVFTWAIVNCVTCRMSFFIQNPPPTGTMTSDRWNERRSFRPTETWASIGFSRKIPVTLSTIIDGCKNRTTCFSCLSIHIGGDVDLPWIVSNRSRTIVDHVQFSAASIEMQPPAIGRISTCHQSSACHLCHASDFDCAPNNWPICKEKYINSGWQWSRIVWNACSNWNAWKLPVFWSFIVGARQREHCIFMVCIQQWLAIVWIEYREILLKELTHNVRTSLIDEIQSFCRWHFWLLFIVDIEPDLGR